MVLLSSSIYACFQPNFIYFWMTDPHLCFCTDQFVSTPVWNRFGHSESARANIKLGISSEEENGQKVNRSLLFYRWHDSPNESPRMTSYVSHHVILVYILEIIYIQTEKISHYPAKLIYLNFQPLEVVSRYRDPQPQVVENYPYLFNSRLNIYKCWCLNIIVSYLIGK